MADGERLEPGDTLTGYCCGYFGRDSYCDKHVIAAGRDWVLVREEEENENVLVAQDPDIHRLLRASQEES